MTEFFRGQVFNGNIPEFKYNENITPRPGFVLQGKHRLIMLHDHDFSGIDIRQALVVPITSAKAEVGRAQREGRSVIASYVEIDKLRHPFLDDDSYISVGQIMPINRKWLIEEQPIGEVESDKMAEVDFVMIRTYGLHETVMAYVAERIKEELGRMWIDTSEEEVAADRQGS